jgi:hypothetical protein
MWLDEGMDAGDALFFFVLAMADLCLIVSLRLRRRRALRARNMMRSLELYVRREIAPAPGAEPARRRLALAS